MVLYFVSGSTLSLSRGVRFATPPGPWKETTRAQLSTLIRGNLGGGCFFVYGCNLDGVVM